MNEKRAEALDAILNGVPVFLAFLMPVFFLPITSEFFEFNKLMLLAGATGLMLVAWAVKMLVVGRVEVSKSPMDIALAALLILFMLSSLFSLNKTASIFGAQGRWFPSLISILILAVFYYVVASNVKSRANINGILIAFILGTTVSTFTALLGYFGITLGNAPYLVTGNFTLTGSTVTTAAVAAIALILTVNYILTSQQLQIKYLMLLAFVINMLGVALLGTLPVWAVIAAGVVGLVLFTPVELIRKNSLFLTIAGGAVFAVVLVIMVPVTRDLIVNDGYAQEIRLSPTNSWIVASSVIRDFPLLGTGPSTFSVNFTRYRPLNMNNTDQWALRFDKPYSEVFNIMSAFGIVGAIVFGFFFVKVVKFVLGTRSASHDGLVNALSLGVLSVVVLFIFSYATILTMFMLFMFLALIVAEAASNAEKPHVETVMLSLSSVSSVSIIGELSGSRETFQYIMAVPMFALVAVGGFYMYKLYAGEYYLRSAVTALRDTRASEAYAFLGNAINVNPRREAYHNSYAQTNLALANAIAARGDQLTDDDRTTISTLIGQAIRSSRISTEIVNPLNVASWETRAAVYRALVGIAQDADQWAIRAYNTAIQLDPTNPRLRLELGGVYYAAGDYLSAANLFRQATNLKSDYANAHYNFAQSLKQLEAFADAQRELEITRRLVAEGTSDYDLVVAELEELQNLPAVAGAQTQPTVEELSGEITDEEATEQEPLVNAGEEQVIESGPEINLNEEGQTGQEEEQSDNESVGSTQPSQP